MLHQSSLLPMLGAIFCGVGGGLVYFGGLLLTIRAGLTSKVPALWFCASFLIRTALAVVALLWIAQGGWQALLACLSGFMVGRMLVQYVSRAPRRANRGPRRVASLSTGPAE